MFPRKMFENLRTVMTIFALFEQFSGKVCLCFWPLIFSASSHRLSYILLAQFRLCLLKTTKAYCYEEVRNYGNLSTVLLKMAGEGGCIPTGSATAHEYNENLIFRFLYLAFIKPTNVQVFFS